MGSNNLDVNMDVDQFADLPSKDRDIVMFKYLCKIDKEGCKFAKSHEKISAKKVLAAFVSAAIIGSALGPVFEKLGFIKLLTKLGLV